ncbi:unnamed protein product [Leptidea sinapis]|uniref:Dynein heavy chain coiled coil stalk domain-containing protein n=1 Tax=Leptidea sinapis TaxID=189913 RepID=A0A5E4QXL6_9NEOP|nr:unnamed protein product [Leptidea sinapis]
MVKLYSEKRADLEEQQLHLNVGLGKIAETVEQVEEMQKSLAVKSQELRAKNEAANAKLKQMVKDQQEAEKKKVESQEIQVALEKQTKEIEAKRRDVMADLAQVEPAVIEAQNAVRSIKKQQLVEVRSMSNPPPVVKMALESICTLLEEKSDTWKGIRSAVMKDNFISTIVNFETENITDDVREKMKTRYLSNPDYNFEKVNRASMACGPMVKWAIAQIEYADMLKRVEPLRNELKALEDRAQSNVKAGTEVRDLIAQLEKSIASYKEEYAQLISQAQAIKTDLENVDRSIALLKSLVIERERWESSSETFRSQMSTIVGDVLLSAAFITYGGYFDQHYRQNLFSTWTSHLGSANIKFRADIARTEYLSNPDERLRWQANALPSDELCVENAIMLKRFNRYPLIIDPSGQATEFIMREFKDRKITKTSFLDDSFRKNLESALRFGNPLLVQDVENYDPILNPVLNRELRRTGGRVLITLGDQDIDLSPSFVIFLSTRDPTVEFPPDMCSRVTFVNFTVTRSSLQSQCLHRLEKSLLQALNDAKGKILDDDSVIATLETLKKEADDIGQKVEETDKVIAEIETVSQQYLPLSQACSSIYFTMESLHQVQFLYQYSLKMFLDIFSSVLVSSGLNGLTDYTARLKIITDELFILKGVGMDTLEREFSVFLRGREGAVATRPQLEVLTAHQHDAALRLSSRLVAFRNLVDKCGSLPELGAWLSQAAPEQVVPTLWDAAPAAPPPPHALAMYRLLLIQTELDLTSITEREINATTPALLCSVPGYDASGRVDDMATELNKPLSSIAIGSAEGFNQAERAINSACKSGRYLEKKLHSLQPHPNFRLFLTTEISPKLPGNLLRAARVIVFEPPPGIRANLLRTFATVPAARMMKPPSERARLYFLLAWFHGIVQERLRYVPLGWAKYYEFNESDLRVACDTLDTWIDSTAMGRTNLPPEKVPWDAIVRLLSQCIYGGKIDNLFDQRLLHSFLTKLFTPKSFEADFALVANVDGASGNQRHITMPDGNRRDQFLKWIEELSDRQTPSWLGLPNNAEKVLLTTQGSDLVSKLLKMQQLEDEEELAYNAANQDDPHSIVVEGDGRPAWMKTLHHTATAWLHVLPKELPTLRRTVDNIKDPLYRFFEREVAAGADLLRRVLHDLRNVTAICEVHTTGNDTKFVLQVRSARESNGECRRQGSMKQTNATRAMVGSLVRGMLPPAWRRYPVARGCTVQAWVDDFGARVRQLAHVSRASADRGAQRLQNVPVWLGGLLNPEAYITATRQCVAQANSWSLEELNLQVRIPEAGESSDAHDEWSFTVTGLKLQGAAVKGNRLLLSNAILTELPHTVLTWIRRRRAGRR